MTMNQAPSRVRAVARVGLEPTQPHAAPATFVRRRRHGYLGPVNVMQLVLMEALVVLVLVLARRSPYLLIIGVVLTLVVVVVTFARSGGRWWVERIMLRRAYQRRKGSGALPANDVRLVALHRLVPDLTVETIDGLGGTQVGIGRDGAGAFAVVAVTPPVGLSGDPLGRLPLSKLAAIVQDAEQPGAVLQVVRHAVPAPGVSLAANQPAAESYRELASHYGISTASDQVTWLAVRFDARRVAEGSVDDPGEPVDVPVMLAAMVRRISKAMRRADLECQVLNGDGLLDALTRSCDLEQPPAGSPPPSPSEVWTAWQSASLHHACYWISGWPDLRNSGALIDEMSRAKASLTSVALVLTPFDDLLELRCLLRVASEPNLLDQACAAAQRVVSNAGGRMFRLDGEQAPAVYATAPTGGGAR